MRCSTLALSLPPLPTQATLRHAGPIVPGHRAWNGRLAPHSRPVETQPDAATLSRLRADLRMVGSETTWVTHGPSYELIARSKADLAIAQPQLDEQAAAFKRVFPNDSLAPVVVTIRRVVPQGKPYVGTAPVPNTARGEVVEVVLPDPKAKIDDKIANSGTGLDEILDASTRTTPVIRAWLSAHASAVTKKPAPQIDADGENTGGSAHRVVGAQDDSADRRGLTRRSLCPRPRRASRDALSTDGLLHDGASDAAHRWR